MAQFTDQSYLLSDQYRDASNLNARIQLHARFSTNPYGWQRWLFDQLDLPAHCRILELGCGPGMLWLDNGARIPAGWEIVLSDLSPGMVEQAQENLAQVSHPFRFETMDAQSIPFGGGRFDAVIANHMLYHVPDRPQALGEIRRVLADGGRLYASTIGAGHMRELGQLVASFDPGLDYRISVPDFTLESGARELAPWFPDVALRRYEDTLLVTEAEPLVDYVFSSFRLEGMVARKVGEFRRFVERTLEEHGPIRIAKDSGLFIGG